MKRLCLFIGLLLMYCFPSAAAWNVAGSNNRYFAITQYAGVQITGQFSVCAWSRWTADQNNSPMLSRWNTGPDYLLLTTTGSNNKVSFVFRKNGLGTNANANSSGTYKNAGWNYFCGVYDGAHALLYINGGVTESVTGDAYSGAVQNSSQDLRISCYGDNAACWNGDLAHVSIWNRAITANDCKTAMYLGAHRVSGLVMYFPLLGYTTDPNMAPLATKNNAVVTVTGGSPTVIGSGAQIQGPYF